jgi:hypothetical protein
MWIARRRGGSLPPISAYRLHGRHYVIDGHHRVSVERSLDAADIDADVIELLPLVANRRAPNDLPQPVSRVRLAQPAVAEESDRLGPSRLSRF